MANGLSRLHQSIVEHYDLEELRTLCFDLGVNYDDLRGEGLSAKARELILRLGRRRQLDTLLVTLRQSRPGSFSREELRTDKAALDALYAELPAFEASAGSVWVSLGARVRNFVARHWPVLLAMLVADGVLLFLYKSLRDRYLIGASVGTGAVVLATLAILGWYVLRSRRWRGVWLWAMTLGASLLFVGGLAWQARRILQPARFPPQVFGIAVARFGKGESFHVTSLSRDVTDQITRGLKDTIQGNPDWDEVRVMPVGLVTNGDQAQEWGERVRADLVVWGQVVTIGEGTVSVHLDHPDPRPSF